MQFSCEWCVEMKNRPLGRAIWNTESPICDFRIFIHNTILKVVLFEKKFVYVKNFFVPLHAQRFLVIKLHIST